MRKNYARFVFQASEDGETVTEDLLRETINEQGTKAKVDYLEESSVMPGIPYQIFGIGICEEDLPPDSTRDEDLYQTAYNFHMALSAKGVDTGVERRKALPGSSYPEQTVSVRI